LCIRTRRSSAVVPAWPGHHRFSVRHRRCIASRGTTLAPQLPECLMSFPFARLAAVAFALHAPVLAAQSDAVKKDVAALQGTWSMLWGESEGSRFGGVMLTGSK